jgi:hypothetical protein
MNEEEKDVAETSPEQPVQPVEAVVDTTPVAETEPVAPVEAVVPEAPVEEKPVEPVVEVEPEPVEEPVVNARLDGLRCPTCRDIKSDAQLMKEPLDYRKNADGSVTPTRYSVFCSLCQAFLCIYDPMAQQELRDMLEDRNRKEMHKVKTRKKAHETQSEA